MLHGVDHVALLLTMLRHMRSKSGQHGPNTLTSVLRFDSGAVCADLQFIVFFAVRVIGVIMFLLVGRVCVCVVYQCHRCSNCWSMLFLL